MSSIARAIALFSVITISLLSCNQDPCNGKNCDNGVCDAVSGDCICIDGYQFGADNLCTVEWTTKFVKSYTVTDSCIGMNPGSTTYPVVITSTSPTTLSLDNLGNKGLAMTATHTNSTNFTINETLSNGKVVVGTGSLLNDTIFTINYIYGDTTQASQIDTCTASFK